MKILVCISKTPDTTAKIAFADNNTKFAADGFQVHLLDLRNHGKSFHSDEFSYEVMAQDVFDYCQAHHLEKVSIIGHSMGGKTAMWLALTQPDLVRRLCVVDIANQNLEHQLDVVKMDVQQNQDALNLDVVLTFLDVVNLAHYLQVFVVDVELRHQLKMDYFLDVVDVELRYLLNFQ